MKRCICATCLCLLACLCAEPCPAGEDLSESPQFRKTWQDMSALAEEAAPQAVAPDRYDRSLLQKLSGRESDFGRLMRRAVEMLANTAGMEHLDEIYALQADISRWRQQVASFRKERVGAPEESRNPLTDTRAKLDRKIGDREEKIAAATARIEVLKANLLLIMRQKGLEISAEQLDYLIIAAEGGDVLHIMAATENLANIQLAIERELRRDASSAELVKAYTGIYLVTLEAYSYAHAVALENITEKYAGRVDRIVAEAAANRDEARALLKDATPADRANLESNLRISARTIEVGRMYRSILDRRAASLKRSRAAVEKKLNIARNTYKTVIAGSRLIELVRTGGGEYGAVLDFNMPELKNIYEDALLDEFKAIAAQVREG